MYLLVRVLVREIVRCTVQYCTVPYCTGYETIVQYVVKKHCDRWTQGPSTKAASLVPFPFYTHPSFSEVIKSITPSRILPQPRISRVIFKMMLVSISQMTSIFGK